MKRVAFFGGSFDPPHLSHVLMATYVACRGQFDELRLIPVATHAFGKSMAPFEVRCAMLRAAVRHLGPAVRVDTIEQELPPPNFTIDTVRAMLARETDITLTMVCGADVYAARKTWKAWPELNDLIDLMVFERAGCKAPPGIEIHGPLPEVSSSALRACLSRGEDVDHLVPAPAMAVLLEHGLYQR